MTPLQEDIIKAHKRHKSATSREIAKLTNSTHAHVLRTLKRFNLIQDNIKRYKDNRADILAGIQDRLLSSITLEDVQKTSLRDKIVSAGILYDKERLERDQATMIVKPLVTIQDLKEPIDITPETEQIDQD